MPTARQLRTLAAQARRDAARWRSKAALADEQARELDRLAAMLDRSGLPDTEKDRSIIGSNMHVETAPPTKKLRISASRSKVDSDAKRALIDAGVTPEDVAAELDVGRSTVNAWCLGKRAIPASHRDALAKAHGKRKAIAASVWPRVA